jgi:anti-sigma factor RsiW
MSSKPDPLELNAAVDCELELARQLALDASEDPAVRAELAELRALRSAVREEATYHTAPGDLQRRVRAQLAREVAGAQPPLRGWLRWRIAWPSFAAGAAAVGVAFFAVQWALQPWQATQRIEDEVVASHSRAVVAQRLVDVVSSDHHTVKPWLSARLDFSPPVDPPPGTQLLGARIDYIAGRPAAVLVMQHGGHTVESWSWPVQQGDADVTWSEQRGLRMARWTAKGLRHWVLSDLNAQEFTDLVKALREGG